MYYVAFTLVSSAPVICPGHSNYHNSYKVKGSILQRWCVNCLRIFKHGSLYITILNCLSPFRQPWDGTEENI